VDTLDSIFVAVFLDVNDGLKVYIVAKSISTVNFENGGKFTARVLPRPVGTNMNSNTTGGRIKSVAVGGAVFVLI